jgi:D-alanyl-D-alanine carboxypeptidase
LIVTAESKGLHYIAIVMCAKATYNDDGDIVRFGSYEEVKQLLNKGFNNHRVTQVLSDEQILTQYPVSSGENSVAVGPSETFFTVLPTDIISTELSYRYQSTPALTAPVEAGEYINSVQVWYGNVCVAQSPILTKNSSGVITVADQSGNIEKTGEGLKIFMRLLAILAVLLLFAFMVLLILRVLRKAQIQAQHRRRCRNRRRSR